MRYGKRHYHPVFLWSRIKLLWPLLVWLAAIILIVLLYSYAGRYGSLAGVVRIVRDELAPLETSRVKSVAVVPGQHVDQGDVLVQMDTSILNTRLEIEKLQIQRQFDRQVQQLKVSIREISLSQAENKAELAIVGAEVQRMDQLVDDNLLDEQTVAELRARQRVLQEAVKEYPRMLEAAGNELGEARRLRESVEQLLDGVPNPGKPPSSGEHIGLLRKRSSSYTLRALRPGIVSEVDCESGQVLAAGQVAITVVAEAPIQILGFLPEVNAHDLETGMQAYIARKSAPDDTFEAVLTAIGPEIRALPGRLSNIPGRRMRGLRLVFEPKEECDLLPGEAVSIRVAGTPATQRLIEFATDLFRFGGHE